MQRKGRGQALVEFAIVIGVAMVLAIGAIQALFCYYTVRQTRAAAEEIADLAAIHGGDTAVVRQEIPAILEGHRLDGTLAEITIEPPAAAYLDTITVTLRYNAEVRFYGLFTLRLPEQHVMRLCEGG